MMDPAKSKLRVHGHTATDLVSRVRSAASFSDGMTLEQKSGIERFSTLLENPLKSFTVENIVEKFFHLFDDLFFGRSLRYCVSTKVESNAVPTNTCCSGLATGGKLIVQYDETSPTSKSKILGRLLHDMIHVYLWRYGERSFTNDKLFEDGWGFSGHGAAWQDIAIILQTAMKEYGLPLSVGRNEALRVECESFAEMVKSMGRNLESTGNNGQQSKQEPIIQRLDSERIGGNGARPRSPRKGRYPTRHLRGKSKTVTKRKPALIQRVEVQEGEVELSKQAIEQRKVLEEKVEDCIGVLKAL